MKSNKGIFFPISFFSIGFLCSSWGYFHPHAPFWEYLLVSLFSIPLYWLYRTNNAKHTPSHHEMENTIKLLRQSEHGYSKLIEFLPVPAIAHSFGMITYVNRATLNILGFEKIDQIYGKPIYRFINSDHHACLKEQFQKVISNSEDVSDFKDCELVGKDGRKISVEASSMVFQIDEYNMILTVFHDITYRKIEEEMMRKMAYVCPLTQLSNRRHFEVMLNHQLVKSSQSNHPFYLLFIDLDGFKKVNDTLGHAAGDAVLQMAAQRLTHCVRSGDFVARFAGDEFIVMLPEVQQEDAIVISQRIILAMRSAMIIKGEVVNVTASIGISNYPQDGETAELLIKHADEAMYKAKQNGKNNYHIFQTA